VASVAAHPPGHLHRILKRISNLSEKDCNERRAETDPPVEVCLLAKKPFRKSIAPEEIRCAAAIKIGCRRSAKHSIYEFTRDGCDARPG